MKIKSYVFIFFLSIGFNLVISAQEYIAPESEFTYELKVTIDPVMKLGLIPYGERVIITILEGTFECFK